MNIFNLTALGLGQKIKTREISVKEAVQAAVAKVKEQDHAYNAFITLCEEEALTQAEQVQAKINDGTLQSPLAGVPVAVKDNICTLGVKTTCASKMLETFVPTYEATVMERLQEAGGILFGKCNMDEFAMGSTSETSYYGPVRNPADVTRVSGGSSGGSAVAVAAKEAWYTLGSDTGGSIRQPCSYTGTVGIKPTYGLVSRYGLIAHASSMDQIGPIARNVSDCAAALNLIAGYDAKDSTSGNRPKEDYLKALRPDVKGMRIGLPKEYFAPGTDPQVKDAVLQAARQFETMGAKVEECSMPILKYAVPAYYVLASAEASSNLARYDGIRFGHRAATFTDLEDFYCKSRTEGFGMEVKRRIMLGTFALSAGYYDAYYNKALQVKTLIRQAFADNFSKYDLLLTPVAPTTAPKLGESLQDPVKMYQSDFCTVAVNLAGLPALALPCGKDAGGLPIGLQLIGKQFDEATLIRAAYTYEQEVVL